MKKTGQLLKEKRESANLSLSEVALATKINPKILNAIENGDESKLPAKTFLKGFVRSYALFLKMDVDIVLRTFQEETGGLTVERVHEAYQTENASASGGSRRRVSDENSSGLRTAAVIVIVVLIGLIIGVRELIEKYQRERTIEKSESIKVSPLLQPPLEPAKAVDTNSAALTNDSAPIKETVTPPAPEVKAKEVKPVEVKAEPPPPATKPVQVPVPEPAPEAKTVEPPAPTPVKAVKSEIILEALDQVNIVMHIKGEVKKISLSATQVHTIHSDQPVMLELSDGGAVNIIVNGHERGVPGDLGKPKQITVP